MSQETGAVSQEPGAWSQEPGAWSQEPGSGGRTVFLDRDGVINEDTGYIMRPEAFVLRPGAAAAIRVIQQLGYRLIVVTNQSGIGRGYYSEDDYGRVTQHMLALLASSGIRFTAVYHCPHTKDDGCTCRKPAAGMLVRAAAEHQVDLSRAWLVGDKSSDIEAAHRAGVSKTMRIQSPYDDDPAHAKPVFVGDSLAAIIPHLRREVEEGEQRPA